jgi:hypothetical protein
MPPVNFTRDDAQRIVNLAQNSPLKNLADAADTANLLQRFADWANPQFPGPVSPLSATPAPIPPATANSAAPSTVARAVRAAINQSAKMAPATPKSTPRIAVPRAGQRVVAKKES